MTPVLAQPSQINTCAERHTTMKNNTFVLTILTVIFSTCLIVANIIAGKLFSLPFGIVLTTGVFIFPIVYLINDIIPEVYGRETAKKTIWIGFFANLIAVIFFYLSLIAPYPVFWQNQSAFETVLGFTPRLLLASFVAYLCGTFLNTYVLTWVKKLTGQRLLWVRTISSTIIGESVDSVIFILIAFYGVLPNAALPSMVFAQAAFKTAYEIAATPLTYFFVNLCKKWEKVDQYSVETAGK